MVITRYGDVVTAVDAAMGHRISISSGRGKVLVKFSDGR
jgi:hypothetical protein